MALRKWRCTFYSYYHEFINSHVNGYINYVCFSSFGPYIYIYIYYSTVSLRQRIVSYSLPSWLDGSRHWNMWMFEPWSSSGESEVLNSSGHWMMSSISLEDFFQQICNIHHIFKNNIVDMIVEVVNGMKEDSSGGQWCGKYHIHFLFTSWI